jgi:hypothetical protein
MTERFGHRRAVELGHRNAQARLTERFGHQTIVNEDVVEAQTIDAWRKGNG